MQASELKRLSVYYDVHTELWKLDKPWADMKPDDWTALFQPGIAAVSEGEPQPSHTYVLKPVDGRLQYIRRGRNVRKDESQAIQEADLKLHAISLHVSSAYLCHIHSGVCAYIAFDLRTNLECTCSERGSGSGV
jgi:vacuolar protein sorting-associated protein 13A/C